MAVHQPIALQPSVGDAALIDTAQEFRQYIRAQLTAASGVGGEQGVTSASSFNVTQRGAGANLSVDVAAGNSFVAGDDVTNQGTYQCWNDGTVNVTGITVPGAGTFHHRIVLQIQDKLSNGAWTGYTGAVTAILDTGGGLPAEPASAITLATIDVPSGSGSITNAMINDYRQRVGHPGAVKSADVSRTNTVTFTDDADLQLLNLQANASYRLTGELFYTGGDSGASGPYDFTWKFRVSPGTSVIYTSPRTNSNGNWAGGFSFAASDAPIAQTQGTGKGMAAGIDGTVSTGAAPAYAVLQWAPNNNTGTATRLQQNSVLELRRIS